MITAAFMLAPAAVVGLGTFVATIFDKAHRRRRRAALIDEAYGRQ
jgi:hypothetical protein